ncbi:MAG: hypothetical protein JWR87_513 [Segetibacter sp.]|jgi:hypothetical protein|nr:hypothetical protein [Segetibacter sp.]
MIPVPTHLFTGGKVTGRKIRSACRVIVNISRHYIPWWPKTARTAKAALTTLSITKEKQKPFLSDCHLFG